MVRRCLFLLFAPGLLAGGCFAQQLSSPAQRLSTPSAALCIRFAAPARSFGEAMPTGNGRLGASMYGGVAHERLSLNESSMWSGSRHDADRPDAYKQLPEIRRLLLAGKNAEAEVLVNQSFTSADKGGSDPRYGSYQELGRLELNFDGLDDASATDYRRALDLDAAVATTSFVEHGIHFTREVFTSAPDQAIIVRLGADQPHALSLGISLARAARFQTTVAGRDELLMTGELDSGAPGIAGVRYATRVRVLPVGGSIDATGSTLHVQGADEILLLLTAATDFDGFAGRHTHDPSVASATDLAAAAHRSYPDLLARHQADFQNYFRRVQLQLGPATPDDLRPTVDRLAAASSGASDPGLATLDFQFGRYLLISSSRAGGLPANLQGLWAEGTQIAWNGDWHLNVNVQMNYWPAEPTGLGDLTDPLFALITSLPSPGTRTARSYYAAPGWVAHVMTDAWGFTSPGEQASWGSTSIGSAWLCQHIWMHYLYTGDQAFLRRMYPVLKGAAEFYLSMLVREPQHGWLVTAPSNSPENSFYLPDGQKASVCMGPAIDEEILHFLFGAVAQTEATLHVDPELRKRLEMTEKQLAPIQIGPDGRVLEWLQPYREVDPHHRHVSHLWALYPGDAIDPVTTPQLAAAARQTLLQRGDGATGWSLANKSLLWTRLGDGDHAYKLLQTLWRPVDPVKQNSAGSLPNLWDAHPPFQIDGNFGATAAIAEMLFSSRSDEVRLLPALPSVWTEGSVSGLRGIGGLSANLSWTAGRLTRCTLALQRSRNVTVRYSGQTLILHGRAGQILTLGLDAQGHLMQRS
ncbi:MAG: glycoside hydrolase family 95 protein [Janthinobacterium lividum]